ncbi:MAG: Nicotinate dehydrogenase FAD-subunit [Firmicutes bacterium ADurb.Bin248]|nr:MAG: Nicotinate dehydrogenase FAD-subunit [Firmicutes bacterium ADurb.Bin248]HPK14652.1 xanthine dehydrogenase FAD-binding subunit XdhB [Clostridia bacterium]
MYDMKALYEAKSVPDAISLLQEHPGARILAGGSDVLVQLREGKLAGLEFVSIFKLDELRGVSLEQDGTMRILPLTSFSHVARDPIVNRCVRVLAEAVDKVGGPQVRNIGTIGGNICNGVTSADSASTLVAYDAVVEVTGPEGVRQLPISEWYVGAGKVALRPAELLTAILIKKESYEGYAGFYIKYAMRNAMDIATLGCSVNVKLSGDKKTVADARVAYGVAGPVPMRAKSAEEAARGKPVSEETVEAAAQAALADVNPRTSWRATKEFRLHLVEELARRALKEAINRAGGEI